MWARFCQAANMTLQDSETIVGQSVQVHDDVPHNFGFLLLLDPVIISPPC
jgi:hypothetical protein